MLDSDDLRTLGQGLVLLLAVVILVVVLAAGLGLALRILWVLGGLP